MLTRVDPHTIYSGMCTARFASLFAQPPPPFCRATPHTHPHHSQRAAPVEFYPQPRVSKGISISYVLHLSLLETCRCLCHYRVPLGSVEEWVIVNQRKGRGEGVEACHPSSASSPPLSTTTTTTAIELEGPTASRGEVGSTGSGGHDVVGAAANGGGQHRTRWRRRGLGGQSPEGADRESRPSGGAVELVEDEGGEGGKARLACERSGPGEVTYDGHPFHLHVNHFQVRSLRFSLLACTAGLGCAA